MRQDEEVILSFVNSDSNSSASGGESYHLVQSVVVEQPETRHCLYLKKPQCITTTIDV